jgi:hypothetical protein
MTLYPDFVADLDRFFADPGYIHSDPVSAIRNDAADL